MTNHNVETCKKKEQTIVVAIEIAQPSQKPQKTSSYVYHIYGLNGHKMTDFPKFVEMQKIFHGKFVIVVEVQLVAKTQAVIINVNVVDVNVITKNKTIEEHVFKDRKLRKANSVVDPRKKNG
jgi:hypothetical protein